jgi:hypothetical protein
MSYIYGAAANASKWQMGFNSAFKGLIPSEKHQRGRAAGMRAVDEKYKHSFIWTP